MPWDYNTFNRIKRLRLLDIWICTVKVSPSFAKVSKLYLRLIYKQILLTPKVTTQLRYDYSVRKTKSSLIFSRQFVSLDWLKQILMVSDRQYTPLPNALIKKRNNYSEVPTYICWKIFTFKQSEKDVLWLKIKEFFGVGEGNTVYYKTFHMLSHHAQQTWANTIDRWMGLLFLFYSCFTPLARKGIVSFYCFKKLIPVNSRNRTVVALL